MVMADPSQTQASERKNGAQEEAREGGTRRPITVKKYANRRLYNTQTSSYVTLDDLARMVRAGDDFVVVDAKSGEDLTRSVLAQIIFDQENRGETLLPIPFLRRLIGLYGGNMQSFVPSYLEASMDAFAKNQEAIRRSVTDAFAAPSSGMRMFEDAAKQNMALFEQGLKMFGLQRPGGIGTAGDEADKDAEIEALRGEVERLRAALAEKG